MADCYGCHKPIKDRFLLKALDKLWHEDCLKCGCCGCRLGEVGQTLYTRAGMNLCHRDYLRMFGPAGKCSACNKQIPAFEYVMRAKGNVYHVDCFACQQCNHRFCVGDKFFLLENRIVCENDLPGGPGGPPLTAAAFNRMKGNNNGNMMMPMTMGMNPNAINTNNHLNNNAMIPQNVSNNNGMMAGPPNSGPQPKMTAEFLRRR